MVKFMEAHGDLSKATGGPRSRHFIQKKWKELVIKLNSDGTGDPRTEEKWRKVWSDYKNNCKKKYAKLNRAASGTGKGPPALQMSLTDLENRVIQIIEGHSTIATPVEEAGIPLNEATETVQDLKDKLVSKISLEVNDSDWNTPGTSSQPTIAPPQTQEAEASASFIPNTPVNEQFMPSRKGKTQKKLVKLFLDADKKARKYARNRERVYEELERERLRLREFDLLARIRQRDTELNLQSQWLQFLKEAMDVFVSYMEKKS